MRLRRLLATVANNVNQLARSANIAGQVSERARLEQTLGEVDELVVRLRELTGVEAVIPNVTRGGKTAGVLRYLVGKGKREEHEHPHLVAGSPEAVLMAEGRELTARDAGDLARFLDEPREQFGTRVTIAERDPDGRLVGTRDAHVWHCSLALHPSEPELSDERWREICEQFVAEMRFAGETAPAQCRWVAIRHGRSTGGSDHAHVVVTLVAEDGSKANVHNDRPRAQRACRELEQRFGLRSLEARTRGAGSRALKHGEIAADRRRGREGGGEGRARGALHPAAARAGRARVRGREPQRERVRRPAARAAASRSDPATPRAAPARSPATRSGCRPAATIAGGRCGTAAGASPATSRCRRCGEAGIRTAPPPSAAVDSWRSSAPWRARRPSGGPRSSSAGCCGIAAPARSSASGCSCAAPAPIRRRAATPPAREPPCSRPGR